MDLKNLIPTKAYRCRKGGGNFICVDEIYIYVDEEDKHLIVQQDRFRKTLYEPSEVKEIIVEKQRFFDWGQDAEVALKKIYSKYKHIADHVIFYPANSSNSKILTALEIMGEDINSPEYACTPWTFSSLYYGKNEMEW